MLPYNPDLAPVPAFTLVWGISKISARSKEAVMDGLQDYLRWSAQRASEAEAIKRATAEPSADVCETAP